MTARELIESAVADKFLSIFFHFEAVSFCIALVINLRRQVTVFDILVILYVFEDDCWKIARIHTFELILSLVSYHILFHSGQEFSSTRLPKWMSSTSLIMFVAIAALLLR